MNENTAEMPWLSFPQPIFARLQERSSFNALKAGSAIHNLKLVSDSKNPGNEGFLKKKEHPMGALKVSGRRGKKDRRCLITPPLNFGSGFFQIFFMAKPAPR
jgi:hypothetical protein